MKKVMIWVLMLCMGLLGSASAAWQGADVGTFGGTLTNPGAHTELNGVFEMTADGADIWGGTDGCYFVYQEQWGDGDIICRVDTLTGENGWRKAGLMVRNSLDPNDVEVSMVSAPGQPTATWQQRPEYLAASTSIRDNTQALPVYLKITRIGNLFRGFWSTDGSTWNEEAGPGYQVDNMSETCLWGLVITSHTTASTATARIDNLDGVKGKAVDPDDKPSYVAPAYQDTGLALENVVLDWDQPVNGTPEKYIVSVGSILSLDAASFDPNDIAYEATVAAGTTEYTIPSLINDSTYYWRVDAIYPGDANGFGDIWKFETEKKNPTIITQPVGGAIPPSCALTLEVVAEMTDIDDTLSYQWYKNDAPISGATASTYDATEVGDYKVEVISALWTDIMSDTVTVNYYPQGPAPTNIGIYRDGQTPTETNLMASMYTTFENGLMTYTITGSGQDVWGNSDSFSYSYVLLEGDFDVSTYVAPSAEWGGGSADGWRKCGIMMRETLANNARHRVIAQTPDNGLTWQGRMTAGGGSENANDGGITNDYVRLVRVGDVLTGYSSADGVTWTQYNDAKTYTGLPSEVYVGLMVASHQEFLETTCTFSEVSFLGFPWVPTDPAYSPTPTAAEGWINPDSDLTLSWTESDYAPCDGVYTVYFGSDPENLAPQAGNVIGEAELEYESTYYWQVEVSYDGQSKMSKMWSFDTVKRIPVILSDPAAFTIIPSGTEGTLTVEASALDILPITKVEWYYEAGENDILVYEDNEPELTGVQNGTSFYSSSLTAIVTLAEEGQYYAKVINDADAVDSALANVFTRRMMVELTFDDENDPLAETSDSAFDVQFVASSTATDPKYPVWTADGKVGGAIDMPGEGDPNNGWIDVAKTATELGILGNLPRTASAWVNTRSFNDGGIWDMGNFADSQDFSLRTLGTENQWRAQYWGGADFDTTIDGSNKWASTATLNNWVMMTLVFDGTESKLYVDGHVLNSKAGTLNTADRLSLKVGTYQWNFTDMVAGNIFDGKIDEFRLWNYALTGEEVAALYYEATGESQCAENPTYDLDDDCKVTFTDIAIIAARWLEDGRIHPRQ